MKLPNADKAFVDSEKLVEYCLNPDHPRGKHKARVFHAACGFTSDNADLLKRQLLEAAEFGDAVEAASDVYGSRFNIEYIARGPGGQALVRATWIIRRDEDFPRFVSAYVI